MRRKRLGMSGDAMMVARPPIVVISPIVIPDTPRASRTKLINSRPRLRPVPAIVMQMIAAAIPSFCPKPDLFGIRAASIRGKGNGAQQRQRLLPGVETRMLHDDGHVRRDDKGRTPRAQPGSHSDAVSSYVLFNVPFIPFG
jgi:hypothetical protein